MHVWIADDHPPAQLFLHQLLSAHDRLVVQAFNNGATLLQAWDAAVKRPDCIFCDLQMPETDGFVVIRRLAERGFTGRLVLVTGQNDDLLQASVRLARSRGLRDVHALGKPVRPAKLRSLLELPLASAAALSPARAVQVDDLYTALATRQWQVHYQPKISCLSGQWMGMEALLRWQHPILGAISPGIFIPLAEKAGLITALTEQMMQMALQDLVRLQAQGLDVQMSFNVSMDSLANLDLPEVLCQMFRAANVSQQSVCLEITESRLASRPVDALEILSRLRLLGFELSVDDFGTGYSSLKQLLDLPFQELKIDSSFVSGISDNKSKQAIFTASLGMANSLGIRTVAEGVESASDLAFVLQAGVDCVQGFLISPAMPADALLDWGQAWAQRRAQWWPAYALNS